MRLNYSKADFLFISISNIVSLAVAKETCVGFLDSPTLPEDSPGGLQDGFFSFSLGGYSEMGVKYKSPSNSSIPEQTPITFKIFILLTDGGVNELDAVGCIIMSTIKRK